MAKRLQFGIFVAGLMVLSGCTEQQMKEVLGTYRGTAKAAPGMEKRADIQVSVAALDGIFLTLSQDKSFTMNTTNIVNQGTWSIQHGRVVLQMTMMNGTSLEQMKATQPELAKQMETPSIFDIQENGSLVSASPAGTQPTVILTFEKTK